MPSVMADLISLIDHHIPEGQQSLLDSHSNLEKVAEYCEANYFQFSADSETETEILKSCVKKLQDASPLQKSSKESPTCFRQKSHDRQWISVYHRKYDSKRQKINLSCNYSQTTTEGVGGGHTPPSVSSPFASPPLPPPPPEDDSLYNQNYNPPSPPFLHRNHDPDWVPKNYLEKVVAIYDYAADKKMSFLSLRMQLFMF
ncbi:Abl interactor 2 like protein [Argiope bruennichi]|uniref:Abl interactor 2 like protein n=1 Tax=Argiope bruennichi TaxID=94029 RepID=A0A8T0FH73_ARGBR|nr:Abl interactor 2 like protein [Argiope bruennichi]